MNREDLLEHLRPRVEDLAGELATILWDRLEVQLDQALDAARSALASEIEPSDVEVLTAPERRPERPERRPTRRGLSRQERRELELGQVPPSPDTSEMPAPAPGVTKKGTPRKRTEIRCGKCGEIGRRADTCGITHNPLTKPAASIVSAPRVARAPAPASSSSSKSDRFATIEAAALRRAEKEKRGPRDPDSDDRPTRFEDAEVSADVGLPTPTFSTDF